MKEDLLARSGSCCSKLEASALSRQPAGAQTPRRLKLYLFCSSAWEETKTAITLFSLKLMIWGEALCKYYRARCDYVYMSKYQLNNLWRHYITTAMFWNVFKITIDESYLNVKYACEVSNNGWLTTIIRKGRPAEGQVREIDNQKEGWSGRGRR